MPEVDRVYAVALFDVAKEKDRLDAIREELAQFADASTATASCGSSAPTSPRREDRGPATAVSGADRAHNPRAADQRGGCRGSVRRQLDQL